MKILGIDPGTHLTGFGIIKTGDQLTKIDYGIIRTDRQHSPQRRLAEIYRDIKKIIRSQRPDLIAVEQLFFFKNNKTAFAVGQARGIILLAAEQAKIPLLEPTPLQIKMAVTGNGRADKRQVQEMVKKWLNLTDLSKQDDACDALAAAICAANMKK